MTVFSIMQNRRMSMAAAILLLLTAAYAVCWFFPVSSTDLYMNGEYVATLTTAQSSIYENAVMEKLVWILCAFVLCAVQIALCVCILVRNAAGNRAAGFLVRAADWRFCGKVPLLAAVIVLQAGNLLPYMLVCIRGFPSTDSVRHVVHLQAAGIGMIVLIVLMAVVCCVLYGGRQTEETARSTESQYSVTAQELLRDKALLDSGQMTEDAFAARKEIFLHGTEERK